MLNEIQLEQITQRTLALDVVLWAADLEALRSTSEFSKLRDLEQSGLSVRLEDFIANGLFSEQKAGHPRFADGSALRNLVPSRLGKLLDYFSFDGGSVQSRFLREGDTDKGETEVIGVAGAISVMNAVFDATQADWRKIPIRKGKNKKSLDFDQFSNGLKIVSVEAKGRLGAQAANQAIAGIHKKKEVCRSEVGYASQPLFGVVTVPSIEPSARATCYVADPQVPVIDDDPAKYRLIARLVFYTDVLRSFSRTYLLQSLVQRIEDLARIDNYMSLDRAPLLRMSGESWHVPQSLTRALGDDSKLGIVGDFVFDKSRDSFVFIGLDSTLIQLLAKQDFAALLGFRSALQLNIKRELIQATISTRGLSTGEIQKELTEDDEPQEKSHRLRMRLRGAFGSSDAGVVFGEFRRI